MDKPLIDQIEELLDRKLDKRFDAFGKKLGEEFDHKLGFFIEHMDDKFDSLAEAIQATLEIVSDQPSRGEFNELKDDVKTIKLAVTATNKDLRNWNL